MSQRHPNVLFLLSDEHSFRCLSYRDPQAEGEPVRTPNLDRLAAQAAVFDTTYCQAPLCTPSRICLLTGKSPMQSGGWTNESYLKPQSKTLPATFAEAGYTTCLIGKMHLGGDRQFAGFQHRPYGDLTGRTGHQWEPVATMGGNHVRDRTVDAGITEILESLHQEQVIVRETVSFLREQRHRRPNQPWFLCASFSRPHFPLTAPKRFFDRYWPYGITAPKVGRQGDTAMHPMTRSMAAGFRTEEIGEAEMMKARAAYFACVDYFDEIVGDLLLLLERDGLLEDTIVVYTSDHGELAGEHGMWWKNSWHEAAARVPWIIQTPGHRKGELQPARLDTPVSLADLYPTLCGLAGITAPDDVEGSDLSPALLEGVEPVRGPVFFDNPTPRWGPGTEHRVVRAGRYKYVAFRNASLDLLFDLEADPLEQRDLSDEPAHRRTSEQLRRLVDESWDFDAAQHQQVQDRMEAERHRLPEEYRRWGNLYLMPGNRLVAADTPLYAPVVLTESPKTVFEDWPDAD